MDHGCIYPLLINVFYTQTNYLSKCQKRVVFINLFRRRFNQIFVFTIWFIINKLMYTAIKVYLFFLYTI